MTDITQILDSIVDSSGPEEIEYIGDEFELTATYNIYTKELFISHFFVYNKYRRGNRGTQIYKNIKLYARSNDNINRFKFHIKENKSSTLWLNNLGEEYTKVTVGGVGTVFQIEQLI